MARLYNPADNLMNATASLHHTGDDKQYFHRREDASVVRFYKPVVQLPQPLHKHIDTVCCTTESYTQCKIHSDAI